MARPETAQHEIRRAWDVVDPKPPQSDGEQLARSQRFGHVILHVRGIFDCRLRAITANMFTL